jgi:N-acetylglutamate synthase-like GNAT family acetyltransferase
MNARDKDPIHPTPPLQRPPASRTTDIQLRPLGIDEMSAVRYLHDRAFEHHIGPILSQAEVDAFSEQVHSPEYAERVFSHDPIGAYLHGDLVGTVGSQRSDDGERALRVTQLFVRPMFGRLGIGGTLLTSVEQKALKSGIFSVALQVTRNATEFFEKHGYEVTSYGIGSISGLGGLAVAFLRKDMLTSLASVGGETETAAKRPRPKRARNAAAEPV